MSENEKVVVLLLPGMDGTGILFKEFVRRLPDGIDAKILRYPEDKYLTYEQLAELLICALPVNKPYVIIAESYSGPLAALLAAHPVGDLQAVVFVSSFVSFPCGPIGLWIAKVLPVFLFRPRAPAWILRWFLMNSSTTREIICEVQDVIARVNPEVLARRLREALNADFVEVIRDLHRSNCVFVVGERPSARDSRVTRVPCGKARYRNREDRRSPLSASMRA